MPQDLYYPDHAIVTCSAPITHHADDGCILAVCIKSGELDLALDVYGQMRAEGVTPNLVTYNTLIDVYGKTGQWEEAVRVLDTLDGQVHHIVHLPPCASDRGVRMFGSKHHVLPADLPDFQKLCVRVSDHGCKSACIPSAPNACRTQAHGLGLTDNHVLQGIDPEARTFNTIIIACNMSSQACEAVRVYERMLAAGAQPTATTFTALIRCSSSSSRA